jgi:glycosyltransferase involved in cell wall biosynthesis
MTSPTSVRENLPLSLLEAAACGRAMVATDVPGCRDIVIAGETGLLVALDNPDSLADAIERLAARSAIALPNLRARHAASLSNDSRQRLSADRL